MSSGVVRWVVRCRLVSICRRYCGNSLWRWLAADLVGIGCGISDDRANAQTAVDLSAGTQERDLQSGLGREVELSHTSLGQLGLYSEAVGLQQAELHHDVCGTQ